jgi:predicted RNase H-like HicB family nuclease
MKIPVLIQITPDNRYRATGCEPLVGIVEGDTPEAVLSKMKEIIDDRVARGARIA